MANYFYFIDFFIYFAEKVKQDHIADAIPHDTKWYR